MFLAFVDTSFPLHAFNFGLHRACCDSSNEYSDRPKMRFRSELPRYYIRIDLKRPQEISRVYKYIITR